MSFPEVSVISSHLMLMDLDEVVVEDVVMVMVDIILNTIIVIIILKTRKIPSTTRSGTSLKQHHKMGKIYKTNKLMRIKSLYDCLIKANVVSILDLSNESNTNFQKIDL